MFLILSSQEPDSASIMIVPILWMEKQTHKEMKSFLQSDVARIDSISVRNQTDSEWP